MIHKTYQRLGDIIDMEKFRALPATLVAQLWDAHFSSQADSRFIHAVLGSESYFELANKLDACPMVWMHALMACRFA